MNKLLLVLEYDFGLNLSIQVYLIFKWEKRKLIIIIDLSNTSDCFCKLLHSKTHPWLNFIFDYNDKALTLNVAKQTRVDSGPSWGLLKQSEHKNKRRWHSFLSSTTSPPWNKCYPYQKLPIRCIKTTKLKTHVRNKYMLFTVVLDVCQGQENIMAEATFLLSVHASI